MDDETILLVTAYHDGELSPSETLMMEQRIASEPELRALANELHNLSNQLKGVLSVDPPPERLRGKIVSQVGLSEEILVRRASWQWLPIAASLLIGILIGGGLVAGLNVGNGSVDRLISDTVFEAHLRSLVAPQPFDIASSDRHVVKPWFNGKTSVAPSAPDLTSVGFPLIGGRIDIVAGASVPVLVYRHDRHIVSVTIVPRKPGALDDEKTRDGSNLERWNIGDLSYWAVSDLNVADLRQFAAAFRYASQ